LIKKETKSSGTFIDVFAGSASISKAAISSYDNVILNDILYSNNVIYKAFFSEGSVDSDILLSFIDKYNNLVATDLSPNYFSINFGGKFFESNIAIIIGWIREDIEINKSLLSIKEYNILLATLIYNIDKHANTVGHFDAYIKKPIKQRTFHLKLIDYASYSNVSIYRVDANQLSKDVKGDIAYLDPPYNSRQYSRFYHVYETLIKWDKPKLFGVALKPSPENMSDYCKVSAAAVLSDLVLSLDVEYIVVSYNNTYNSKSKSSENKIKYDELITILESVGSTKVFSIPYKHFNTGKTNFNNHKEYLFITKKNGK